MDKNYWHQRWQANEIGFNQLQPNQLMQRYFSSLHLQPGKHVFVPLCGKSLDMVWLAGQGYEVVGVELSAIACEAFFKDNNLTVIATETEHFTVFKGEHITLLSGDFFQLSKACLGNVDVVYDRAAIIALPSDFRRRYSTFLTSMLEVSTQIFLIVTTYNQDEMPGPPFSVDEKEVRLLYGEKYTIQQLYSKQVQEIPTHLCAKGLINATEQIYRLVKKASKTEPGY